MPVSTMMILHPDELLFLVGFGAQESICQHNVITNNVDFPRVVKMKSRARYAVQWRSLIILQ
jgi:hypothetical protein